MATPKATTKAERRALRVIQGAPGKAVVDPSEI
jgi:hypothetical protein